MPLTALQKDVLAILASNRSEESHFAGGVVLNAADDSARFYATTFGFASGYQLGFYNGRFSGNQLIWSGPYTYPTSVGSPRPSIGCDRSGQHLYLTYTEPLDNYLVHFARSLDGGQTWEPAQTLTGPSCDGQRVVVGPDDEVYVFWHDYALEQVRGCKSVDFGVTFGPVFTVGSIHDNAGVNPPGWQPTVAKGLLDECGGLEHFMNSPSIAIDRTIGPRRGSLYLTWAEHGLGTIQPAIDSTGSIPTYFYAQAGTSQIGYDMLGRSPSVPRDGPYRPSSAIFRFSGGAGTTFWLDCAWQNNDFSGSSSEIDLRCGPDTLRLMQIGCRRVFNNVASSRPMIWTLPTDGDTCYLRSPEGTNNADAEWQMHLREYVIDPSEAARDARDVVLVSSSDGGQTWSPKVRVNDDLPRYDNSFPEVTVDRLGRVHVAWYDRREQPECGAWVQTYWTWSSDGGQTFQVSQRVSEQISGPFDSEHNWYAGDHMCLTPVDDDVMVAWVRQTSGNPDIVGSRVSADIVTAVAISGLDATPDGDGIRVHWYLTAGDGIDGFRVHRAESVGGPYLPLINQPLPQDHLGDYVFLDSNVPGGGRYEYRLEVLRAGGTSEWHGPVEVAVPAGRAALHWGNVAPNPSIGSVRMTLVGPTATPIDVRVLDVSGHEVAKVFRGRMENGTGTWTWKGRDRTGRPAPPGVYLLWAWSEGRSVTQRMTLLR